MSQLYQLIERFKIFIQPTDLAMFQTLKPTLHTLNESLTLALDSKEDNITKFSSDLSKDLEDLAIEVLAVRKASQDPMVLNPSSNSSQVIHYLEGLNGQLVRVDGLKDKYEEWSRLFSSHSTDTIDDECMTTKGPSDEMIETSKQVELKSSLWIGLRDWDILVK